MTPEGQYTEVTPPSGSGQKYFSNNGQLHHQQQQQHQQYLSPVGPSKTLPHNGKNNQLLLATSPTGQHYSAYLHYCLADSEYVQQRLAPGLEEVPCHPHHPHCNHVDDQASPGSRLCLHQRDLPTSTTVGQALAAAVRQSRSVTDISRLIMIMIRIIAIMVIMQMPDYLGKPSLLCKQHSWLRAPDDHGRGRFNVDNDDTVIVLLIRMTMKIKIVAMTRLMTLMVMVVMTMVMMVTMISRSLYAHTTRWLL